MTENNIEIMKRVIEEKKKKSAQQGGPIKATQKIGETRKGIKRHKQGGMFDK